MHNIYDGDSGPNDNNDDNICACNAPGGGIDDGGGDDDHGIFILFSWMPFDMEESLTLYSCSFVYEGQVHCHLMARRRY